MRRRRQSPLAAAPRSAGSRPAFAALRRGTTALLVAAFLAPMPDAAVAAQGPGSGRTADGAFVSPFRIDSLAPGVFAAVLRPEVLSFAFANSLFVVGDDGVLVVDTQQSPEAARDVLAAIRARTDRPVRWVVNTHAHGDHYWGNRVYRDAFPGVRFLAHPAARDSILENAERVRLEQMERVAGSAERVRSELREETDTARVRRLEVGLAAREAYARELDSLVIVPPEAVGPDTLAIGGRVVVLVPLGPAHTPGDLAVWLPDSGVLAAGDVVEDGPPWLEGADRDGWLRALGRIRALEPRQVLPAHGVPHRGVGVIDSMRVRVLDADAGG